MRINLICNGDINASSFFIQRSSFRLALKYFCEVVCQKQRGKNYGKYFGCPCVRLCGVADKRITVIAEALPNATVFNALENNLKRKT